MNVYQCLDFIIEHRPNYKRIRLLENEQRGLVLDVESGSETESVGGEGQIVAVNTRNGLTLPGLATY